MDAAQGKRLRRAFEALWLPSLVAGLVSVGVRVVYGPEAGLAFFGGIGMGMLVLIWALGRRCPAGLSERRPDGTERGGW